jgi:hypothetical protein
MIHDSDDPGVRRNLSRKKRKARFFSADEEHSFTDTGTDGIHRDERSPRRHAVRIQWLKHHQFDPVQVLILDGGYDVTDDSGELHGDYDPSVTST